MINIKKSFRNYITASTEKNNLKTEMGRKTTV